MLIKRKLYSVIDEEGNLGYYLYDENNGEEKLFSVVEDERLYASVRHMKKAVSTAINKGSQGKYAMGDLNRLIGNPHLRGGEKLLNNPNTDKVYKSVYNKANKISGGEISRRISKPEAVKEMRSNSLMLINKPGSRKLGKGDAQNFINYTNNAFSKLRQS